jgi:hypothetical protein
LPIKLKLLLVPFNNLLENGGYFYVDILSVDAILTNVVPDDKLFGNKPYTPENLRAFEKFFSELFAGLTQDRCDGVRFCTPDLPMTNGHFVLTLPLQTGGTGVMASAPLLEIRKKA